MMSSNKFMLVCVYLYGFLPTERQGKGAGWQRAAGRRRRRRRGGDAA
eukprot:SAG22_NODE_20084_length_268_cov_3.307692_1_plen_46_part_10